MGICQTEKVDIKHFISKEHTFRKNASKMNLSKKNQNNNNSDNNSSLNSTSINNVLFNNTKRNSSLNKKTKKIPQKSIFQNITYNNNYYTNPKYNTLNNKIDRKNILKPSTLRKIPNPHHIRDIKDEKEKCPIDNNRAKFKKGLKNEENKSNNIILISPNKIHNSNSLGNVRSKSANNKTEKSKYIEKKIIKDDDDTDKILLHLNEEIKIKNNKTKNNLQILTFNDEKKEEDIELYYLNEFHFNSENKYSTSKDFDVLLQSPIFKNKINFTNILLLLPERQWYNEVIELSDLIKANRQKQNYDPIVFYEYFNKFIKIYNHFNHLVWALAYFYSNSLLFNKSAWFKKKLKLPIYNSLEWIKGFDWKGLHIRVLTYEQGKKLIHEVKALNYILFDYLQLFNNSENSNIKSNNLLSNEIIFPFMSYAYIGGVILYVSVEIKKLFYDENFLMSNVNLKDEKKLDLMRKSLIKHNIRLSFKEENNDIANDDDMDSIIENISFEENILNEQINLSNYSKEDLNNTKIMHKINENNLLKIFEESNDNINERKFKFILINIYSLLPNLFKEDDKTIYHKFNQLNCIDIKNEFESPRYLNLTKINNLDKNNELSVVSKLIRIKATKENIGIYQNRIDNIKYKILYDNSKKGNKINEQVTKFFVQFPLIQNSELSRLLTTEYLNVGNLNIILNKYNTENTQEIPDRNIIIYRTTFQTKMKFSIISYSKEQAFPKSTEEYISYFKQVCKEMTENSNKIRNIDNLFDFCRRFGLNKKFLPFCLEFIEDEYLTNLIQIYLYVSFIKKLYNYQEGQTLLMKLAIFERNKDESIINSSDFIKDNNIIEMQKQFIINIIKLLFLPIESLKEEGSQEPFSKKFFQNISFFIFLKMLKIKNYEKYINFKSSLSQLEIKHILIEFNEISRKNPFLFIDSLEKMINFRMKPFIKYRASIDINNLRNLTKEDIVIFSPKIKSFFEFSTLTSYIFTDFASNSPPPKNNDNKNNNMNPILSNINLDNFYQNLIFKNPISFDKNNNIIIQNNPYYIYNNEIMNKFCYILEQIYDGIISYNGEKELMLFKSYLYSLLNSIFCNDNINEAKDILIKIKENLKNQCLFSFTQYSVLNLLEALISMEDITYREELYSKVVILYLLNQGDIRSQNCNIHQFLMFPLFQLSKLNDYYNNNYINNYLNELFFILDKKIKEKVEKDNINKKLNLGYYSFPTSSLLSRKNFKDIKDIKDLKELQNNKNFLDDIYFKCFICNVIIDYFYSIDNLLFDDDFLLYYKLKIKPDKVKDNETLFNDNKKNLLNEPYNSINKYITEYLLDEMSYQKYAPSNIVISFGNNCYSQTAQDNAKIVFTPRIIYSLLNKKIKKIFSGQDYNFVIDGNNQIYSWGLNLDGQCGIQDIEIIKSPTEIKIPDLETDEIIIDITCGYKSTYFLSNKNKLYLCGYNLLTKKAYFTPKRIEFSFEKEKITKVEAGEKFCLILTGLGNVYSFGRGEYGQLGQGRNNVNNNNEPKQVQNIRNIDFISCGYNHSFAIGKNNIIFCWGLNQRGQLGLNDNILYIPQKMILNHEIDNIFCGKDYTIFHTNKNEILVCGKNEEGELGIGKEVYLDFEKNNGCIFPIKVDQFYNLEIIKVVCGEDNCIAMVKDSTTKMINIWSWGSNKKGQLGFGNDIENNRPKPIPTLLEYINHFPKDITCGKNHCLVLLERNDEIKIDNKQIINDLILKYNKF